MSLPGLDLSEYQPTTPPLAGMAFVFAKATEGDGYADPRYRQHADAAKASGAVLGAYHFGRSEASGASQAAHFLSVIADDTRLVALDIEGKHAPSAAQSREFIAACRAAGKTTGVYASESGFPSLGQDFDWVAHYGVAAPSRRWDFHQWTSGGHLPGYAPRLDLDRFNGTAAELRALAGLTEDEMLPAAPDTNATPFDQLVDLKAGCVITAADGRKVPLKSGGTGVWSPCASTADGRIVRFTTGGIGQLGTVALADCSNMRPRVPGAGSQVYTVTVTGQALSVAGPK